MKVLGLTGLACSGKTTVAKILEKAGYKIYTFSQVLYEECKKLGLLNNKIQNLKNALSKLGDELRKERGEGFLAEILVEKIKAEKTKKVCVDGFRSPAEVSIFRKNFENFVLIRIEASKKIRFERAKKLSPNLTFEKFEERDKRDIENKGLRKTLELADLTIRNEGSKEELEEKVKSLLESI